MKSTAQIEIFSKVSFTQKLLFTKHLSVMIKSGVPITEALQLLIDQTNSPKFKKIITKVKENVENGSSLSSALEKHSKVFDRFYTSMVATGEESGTLEENLGFLAIQLEKEYSLRKKIQGAMLYPGIILGSVVIMGGFISFFILPQLVDFFKAFDTELPLTTKILLFVANNIKDNGIIILSGLTLIIFIFLSLIKIPSIKFKWHSIILKFPLVGKLIIYSQIARFTRNLGTLLKSGVPVMKSFSTTANTLSNLKIKNDIENLSKSLDKGENIGKTLEEKSYKEIPPIVGKMISVGERSGNLDETLIYLAEFYEEEIDSVSKNLSTILEPILLIGIGLVVGFIALAIISPIYELTGSIRR